ncbi:MAG: GNAT family N-acetyltransferase [Pseudomonadota bacterium]
MENDDIIIRHDRREGDNELIVDLHRRGYAQEGDRFGETFPPFVLETVLAADLDAAGGSRVWFAEMGGQTIGCTAMIDRGVRGQLRWVVLLPAARGRGVGKRLFDLAMTHAHRQGWTEVFLETTDGLDASMTLYRKAGFTEVEVSEADLWHGRGQLIVMAKHI